MPDPHAARRKIFHCRAEARPIKDQSTEKECRSRFIATSKRGRQRLLIAIKTADLVAENDSAANQTIKFLTAHYEQGEREN